jgi:miniconductance mechanosensitive channel
VGGYEYIMADILDHLLASARYFDLEIFELEGASSSHA